MKAKPKDIVASVLARLRNEAKTQGAPFNQVLQFYAIERFLYRLSKSKHVDGVLLKGALLLKTLDIPRARPTMDIDFLRQGKADREALIAIVRDCASITDESDGITFDSESVRAEEIDKDAEYQGTRVRIEARMDNVRLSVQVDFGVGDAVSPGPRLIEYPVLLDSAAAPTLRAYPVESAVAEKFQAMVQLDVANSRLKDFYDIWVCSRHLEFHGPTLAKSFTATFERRKTAIPAEPPVALTRAYFGDGARGQQWDAFANRIGERRLVGRFAAVVAELKEFLMPPSVAAARKELFPMHWRAEGPWREKSGP